jgi:hypothetical protein
MNWLCECGIVNPFQEKECGQCGELRADSWEASDRATVIAVRVQGPKGGCYDRCYQLPPKFKFKDPTMASLCHQPFVEAGKDDSCN